MRRGELRHYARGAFLLMTFAACGQQSGCSGCAQDGEPFPDKDKVHSAVQVRLTEQGLDFLEESLEPLLAGALPGGLDICLPGQGGEVDLLVAQVRYGFCIDEPCDDDPNTMGCNLDIEIGAIDLSAVEPNRLRAVIEFEELATRIPVFAEGIIECALVIDGPGFAVQMDVVLETPDPTRDLTFHIEDPVYQLAELNPRFEPGADGLLTPLCGAISDVLDLPIIGDFILGAMQGLIDGFLADAINGFVQDFTCRKCDEMTACPVAGGAACEGGRCMLEGACLPAPLGVEGELDIGALLGSMAAGLDARLKYIATPGSYVEVEGAGLSLGVISGASAEQSRCVPRRALPDPDVEPPRAVALSGNLDPSGNAYEVGIGITDVVLRRFMWAFYTSGALCLGLDSSTVEQLNTGTLRLLLPNLLTLTRGDTNVAITLSPQEVPIAHIGANTVMPDPENEGQLLLDDPLLTLEIPELWMDFHAFFEDRWVRIFSLKADVVVPIGLAFAPDNGVIPVIGDLTGALTNVETANGEIMLDDPQVFAGLLPVLIGPLVGGLAGGLSDPIALPDVMGFALDLQEGSITGVEDNTMLAIFANLERAPPPEEGMGAAFSVETRATVLDVEVPRTEGFELEAGEDVWKRISVRVANEAWDGTADEAAMEFQWRVDDHGWSLFTPAAEMVVRSPAFSLQGRHRIYVRGRRIDDYRTLDPSPAEVEVLIDSVPPELSLRQDANVVRLEANDLVSAREALTLVARRDGGRWIAVAGDVVEIDGAALIEVRVADEAENHATGTVMVKRSELIGRPPHDVRVGGEAGGCGCGCRVAHGGGSSVLLGLPFVLLVGLRRRRLAALLLLVLIALGCDDSSAGSDGDEDAGPGDGGMQCTSDDACGPNEKCDDGRCHIVSCVDDPTACDVLSCEDGEAATCNAMGVCECEMFCAEGCGEGEYCCLARNACEPTPEACDGAECPPGHSMMVTVGGELDIDSCVLEGAQCDCVENEPVDPGHIGRHSDFVVVDGTAYFSAYAEGTGDLVVGPYAAGVGFEWSWVDGVPEGEVTGAPSGPRGGVADAGSNVGRYTAIAAGPEGQLHVAYYDVDAGALKYAHGGRGPDGGHTWTVLTLDDTGDAGRWASISVDARGVPGIAYRMASRPAAEDEMEGTFYSEVRYLLAKNTDPRADADWNPPFVLATSPLDGEAVDTGAYPEGTGLFTAQLHDRAGAPVVAWYDRTFGQLWWTRFVDAGFAEPELLAGWGHESRDGDMGTNIDMAIDEAGEIHLCFQDGLSDSLVYLAPGIGSWEDIDDGVRTDTGGREHAVHVVGEDCNILLDRNGRPVVVYQDATGHDLMMAWRPEDQGEGENWPHRDLRGAENMYRGAFGFYARAQIIGNQLWVSNYVYRHHESPPTQGLELVVEDLD